MTCTWVGSEGYNNILSPTLSTLSTVFQQHVHRIMHMLYFRIDESLLTQQHLDKLPPIYPRVVHKLMHMWMQQQTRLPLV